ncbi:MAG: DUF4332 domain-containing protein [Anaerolineae bacterium]|jgi:predicted flap endonuclease-1-like 5' DNA nuclease|nr:DUF4332 domain-containing protein [Anaerolineae bacterium]
MTKLIAVEGIGPVYARKLTDAGVTSIENLLERGATPQGRKELAEVTDITSTLILEWVNRVDLFRVKGIGEEYSDLLEAAGVDTVPELAQRNGANLYARLKETNEAKHLVRRLPAQSQVESWVAAAKELPRKVSY